MMLSGRVATVFRSAIDVDDLNGLLSVYSVWYANWYTRMSI